MRNLRVILAAVLMGSFLVVLPNENSSTTSAAQPLPSCDYRNVLTRHRAYSDWWRTLLDTTYMLPRSYAPRDLVPVSRAGISGRGYVRRIVLNDLRAMARAAKMAGAPIAVQSAYRSYATQAATFRYWVKVAGYAAALRASARPGHSEHQLGTAVDFKSLGGPAPWNVSDWAKTPAGAWMAANAWRYGWVMSYPAGKSDISCYQYEPWHYRYVGRKAAQAIHNAQVVLRAWLWSRYGPN